MTNRHKLMNAWRQADIDKFLDEFKDFDMSKYRYSNIYAYDFAAQSMEFYEPLKDHLTNITDVVAYLKKLQIDRGGCWRFEMEIEDADAITWNWIEIGEWYLEYDFYDPIR